MMRDCGLFPRSPYAPGAKGLFLSDHFNRSPWFQPVCAICCLHQCQINLRWSSSNQRALMPPSCLIKPEYSASLHALHMPARHCAILLVPTDWETTVPKHAPNVASVWYSTLFLVYSLFFQSGISNSIKIISLSLSFLISLCYPLKPFCFFLISFLSQEKHNFRRRALWSRKSMGCSLPSTQGHWTSGLAMPKLVPNPHISERSSSVRGWQQLKTCPAPSRSLTTCLLSDGSTQIKS